MIGGTRILFVVGQPGSLNFFAPLWDKWGTGVGPDWRLIVDPLPGNKVSYNAPARRVEIAAPTPPAIEAALDGWRPDLIVTSTSYKAIERAGMQWAADAGFRSAQLIDAHYEYRRRIAETNGDDSILPDAIIVPDDIAVEEAVAEGLPPNLLVALGNPAWETIATAPPADPRRALFVSQPINSDYGESLGYGQFDALRLALEVATGAQAALDTVLYAPHPRETAVALPVHPALRSVSSAAAGMRETGTVLGIFSSFLIDAALAGRRTISLQPGNGPDHCVLSRHGLIPRAESTADLRRALDAPSPDVAHLRASYVSSVERLDRWLVDAAK